MAGRKNYTDDWSLTEFGNELSSSAVIASDCEVHKSKLGNWSRLKKNVELRDSILGDYSYISSGSVVNASEIGKFNSIGPGTFIGLWEHNTWTTTHSFYLYESSGGFVKGYENYEMDKIRTKIDNDVWIGANVTINKGIHIKSGTIIGSGAVVTKDIEPYSIIVGNPGKILRYRFETADIDFFLKLNWWDLPRERLQEMVDKRVWYSLAALKKYAVENGLVK